MRNPYNWTRTQPRPEIPRPELGQVVEGLRRGRSYILLAGRGMGKSVFLDQVCEALEDDDGVRVFLIPDPPMKLSEQECLVKLGDVLGVDTGSMDLKGKGVQDVVDLYLRGDVPRDVVLLFDEFDRYARLPESGPNGWPGRSFFNSVEMMRRSPPGGASVGVLAAGSIGSFIFRDVLGSPFADRATRVLLDPFGLDETRQLAEPFATDGRALSEGVLRALGVASGGNPALVTYGLETLWPVASPTEQDVVSAFHRFVDENSDFVRGFRISFANPRLSEAPQRILELIQRSSGEVTRAALEEACGPPDSPLHLDFTDVLTLLKASGLVRMVGSARSDPVAVHPINSILTLPSAPANGPDVRKSLRKEVSSLLARLHVSRADFFRPGDRRGDKQLVPESVFAAFLALGLELLGWLADRETQRGSGRTDVLLRRVGKHDVAVIETKIWGRNDYRDVQRQVESYWSTDTVAAAVVMLTDSEVENWPKAYAAACLEGCEVEALETDLPMHQLQAKSTTADGFDVVVDHYLLRLPRGR